MTELTLNIPDNQFPSFMLLAKKFDIQVIDKKKIVKKLTAKQKKDTDNVDLVEFDLEQKEKKAINIPEETQDIYITPGKHIVKIKAKFKIIHKDTHRVFVD